MKKLLFILLCLILLTSCNTTESPTILDNTGVQSTQPVYTYETNPDTNYFIISDNLTDLATQVLSIIENADNITTPVLILGNNIITNGQLLNAGSSSFPVVTVGSGAGIYVSSTNDGNVGGGIRLRQITSSPAVNDIFGIIFFDGDDLLGVSHTWNRIESYIRDITQDHEETGFKWKTTYNGTINTAMYLTGGGTLYIDLGTSTFDDYDDVLKLKKAFSHNEKQALKDIGVIETIENKDVLNTQNLFALIAGGAIQNRDKIDSMQQEIDFLKEKIFELEKR